VFQQQQSVAIDNSRTLITNLLHHMASLSSLSAAVDIQPSDGPMTSCHNDAAVSSQSGCSRASSSSSSSSERHTTSSADSGVALHCPSLNVINDVMSVTSDDNHTAFVGALVAFIKVRLYDLSLSVSQCLSSETVKYFSVSGTNVIATILSHSYVIL